MRGACSARKNCNRRPQRNSLGKKPEALTGESWNNLIKPCDIPIRPLQACHETIPDEIAGCGNYDWYVFRGFLSGESGRDATQDDHIDLQVDEFLLQARAVDQACPRHSEAQWNSPYPLDIRIDACRR